MWEYSFFIKIVCVEVPDRLLEKSDSVCGLFFVFDIGEIFFLCLFVYVAVLLVLLS